MCFITIFVTVVFIEILHSVTYTVPSVTIDTVTEWIVTEWKIFAFSCLTGAILFSKLMSSSSS